MQSRHARATITAAGSLLAVVLLGGCGTEATAASPAPTEATAELWNEAVRPALVVAAAARVADDLRNAAADQENARGDHGKYLAGTVLFGPGGTVPSAGTTIRVVWATSKEFCLTAFAAGTTTYAWDSTVHRVAAGDCGTGHPDNGGGAYSGPGASPPVGMPVPVGALRGGDGLRVVAAVRARTVAVAVAVAAGRATAPRVGPPPVAGSLPLGVPQDTAGLTTDLTAGCVTVSYSPAAVVVSATVPAAGQDPVLQDSRGCRTGRLTLPDDAQAALKEAVAGPAPFELGGVAIPAPGAVFPEHAGLPTEDVDQGFQAVVSDRFPF